MKYVDIAYRFFGSMSKSTRDNFLDIRESLQKANIAYTLEEYLSISFFTTAIIFSIENVLFAIIFALIGFSIITALLLALTLSLAISGFLFFLFYSYPSTLAKSRASVINKVLPFAASYMASVSSAKMPAIEIFKTLSMFKEYREVRKEAASIVRDVEIFGMNFSTAVKRQARRTPSREFKEILWGINTIVQTGGDLTSYLHDKSNHLMNDYRRRIRKYSQDLSLFVEIYVTLIITGSIFFIVLSSVITTISGGFETAILQTAVVFILLPLISLGFIVIIKSISPLEE